MPTNFPQRGEIYFANLDPVVGHEQGGRRPVLIIQNDLGNQFSPVLIVAAITSAPTKAAYPVDVPIMAGNTGLFKGSRIMLNQIKTIDKQHLEHYIGRLNTRQMEQVDQALILSLGLSASRSK